MERKAPRAVINARNTKKRRNQLLRNGEREKGNLMVYIELAWLREERKEVRDAGRGGHTAPRDVDPHHNPALVYNRHGACTTLTLQPVTGNPVTV